MQQDVEDTSEAIWEFLDSGVVTLPSEYLNKRILTEEKSSKIEGKITLEEIQYGLFTKMRDSSAPGIDGFTFNWLRKFWSSFKTVTLNVINESYRDGTLTTNLKTGIIHLLRKGHCITQRL